MSKLLNIIAVCLVVLVSCGCTPAALPEDKQEEEKPPVEQPVDPQKQEERTTRTLWEGSATLSWTAGPGRITLGADLFEDALPGDCLRFTYDQIDQTWGQAQMVYPDSSKDLVFPEFRSPLVPTDLYGWNFGPCATKATLTDETVAGLKGHGLLIQGANLVFRKIELIPGPGYYEPMKDPDPQKGNAKMHIFLAFGQSNMEGQARVEECDRDGINNRYLMLAAVDFKTPERKKGAWYRAEPPLCRTGTGLSPLDWFGRRVVEALPEDHSVGVINVAVAGCSIDAFINERVDSYLQTSEDWLKNTMALYGNRPFDALVEAALIAQEYGTIEGILVHQGESNTGDIQWPDNLNLVYTRLLDALELKAEDVPLLVGEVVGADQGGSCSYMNTIIARIHDTIPTAWPISSEGCTCASDHVHFDAEGYRKLGRRYAEKMIELKGW